MGIYDLTDLRAEWLKLDIIYEDKKIGKALRRSQGRWYRQLSIIGQPSRLKFRSAEGIFVL